MNEYQKEQLDKANTLASEIKAFYPNVNVIEDKENRVFNVMLEVDGAKYLVTRNYNNAVNVSRYPYQYYKHVSNYTQSEHRKRIYTSNNMKVITKAKLDEKIKEEKNFHNAITLLESQAVESQTNFLNEVKALAKKHANCKVTYSKNYEQTRITDACLEMGGIEMNCELGDDGHISKKLSISYKVDNTLDSFVKLAQNRIKPENFSH